MTLSLADLSPTAAEFTLVNHGKERAYILRPFSYRDYVWLDQKFTIEERGRIFVGVDPQGLCAVAFHQLSTEDKRHIMQTVNVEDVDEEGKAFDAAPTGSEKLFYLMAECEPKEGDANFKALFAAFKKASDLSRIVDKVTPQEGDGAGELKP